MTQASNIRTPGHEESQKEKRLNSRVEKNKRTSCVIRNSSLKSTFVNAKLFC